MRNHEPGAVIAARVLTASGDGRQVVVELFAPCSTGADYECPYRIAGPGVDIRRYAAGLDAFQAIQLAFVAIGAELDAIARKWGVALQWEGGDTGFPP